MWIRCKQWHRGGRGPWGAWAWNPVAPEKLHAIRADVRKDFVAFKQACVERGEPLNQIEEGLEVPVGFTPNDFMVRIARRHGVEADFFTIRDYFQTIQIAGGTWEEGPQEPFQRFPNVLEGKP